MRLLRAPLVGGALSILLLSGCQSSAAPPEVFHWWVGRPAPAFDPDGPPEALRQSLEHLLTRSLVALDTLGRPVLEAAESLSISEDGRRYTFRLRSGLRFTDGSACGSATFREALTAGLARTDHATREWALSAVRGVERVRPRRALPDLGILTPDSLTLVIELSRPDSLLLDKLAIPGVTSAWSVRASGTAWTDVTGLGPYRAVRSDDRRFVLARVGGAGPDTIALRFGSGVPRARSVLRVGEMDLVWPLPPALLEQALPEGFASRAAPARPPRRLSLVLRSDVPPTTKLAARRALAHGVARSEVTRRLGEGARELGEWLPGAGLPRLPGFDPAELLAWLDRGHLGRSFRVRLAYDADGAGAALAPNLEGEWARAGLSAELRPLRGEEFSREALTGQSQAVLVEERGLIPGPVGILAPAVHPLRGPTVGAFRTGWRTRQFDAWLLARNPMPPFPSEDAARRLEDETVVLPLCELDWLWVERVGGMPVSNHPVFGPLPSLAVTPIEPAR